MVLWLAISALSPSGAGVLVAQEPSPYEIFDVMILPEYEHPGVEIQVEGVVKPGRYPRYLELDVSPNTRVALLTKPDSQGNPVSERIETREEDGRTYLPIDISAAWFLLRYYYNPFDRESAERTFTYKLTTNEALSDLHIIVQKPAAARNFRHSLTEANEQVGEFDLIYYQQHVQGLPPGTSFSATVAYDNPTNALTLTELRARMERKQAKGGPGGKTVDGRPLRLTTVLLLLVLSGGCMFIVLRLWARRKAAASTTLSGKARAAAPPKEGSIRSPEERKYCNSCGTQRRPGARFCSNCGKKF